MDKDINTLPKELINAVNAVFNEHSMEVTNFTLSVFSGGGKLRFRGQVHGMRSDGTSISCDFISDPDS